MFRLVKTPLKKSEKKRGWRSRPTKLLPCKTGQSTICPCTHTVFAKFLFSALLSAVNLKRISRLPNINILQKTSCRLLPKKRITKSKSICALTHIMMKTGKQYSNNKTKAVPIIDAAFFLSITKQTAALGFSPCTAAAGRRTLSEFKHLSELFRCLFCLRSSS